jgi:tetratricopeptide (TPR) repeat protein
VIGLIIGMTVCVSSLFFWIRWGIANPPDEILSRGRRELKLGHYAEAEKLALRALELDPKMNEALVLAGECAGAQSEWSRALEYFGRIKSNEARLKISNRLRQADILHRHLHQLAKAERAYRDVLELDADNVSANTGLAQLLCLCGRKREAIPLILRLVRQNAETDMLLLLARNDMFVDDFELLTQAHDANPNDPNPLVGLAWRAYQNDEFPAAEKLLRTSIVVDSQHMAAYVLLGRLLVSTNRTAEFAEWNQSLPFAADEAGDVWNVRGQMAEAVDDIRGAIRCYWEAMRRSPESKTSTFRLVHCLAGVGDTNGVEEFRDRLSAMQSLEEMQNRVLFAADRGRPELLWPLAAAYESAGRLWEAYGWCQFAISVGANAKDLPTNFERLRQAVRNLPLRLVTDSSNIAMKVDLSHYPRPDLRVTSKAPIIDVVRSESLPTFRDDAQAIGVNFEYFNGVKGSPTHRMFEFTGGGIGVLDYDLDAFPDLFFTQGHVWPPGSPDRDQVDQLFRNRAGVAFDDVTTSVGIRERGFGQGVTIGDFNSDGFPDIYVANIGRNQLWRNQGDGTFVDVTELAGLSPTDWTTSCIMVDLTGDGLPDIYDVNYAADADTFDRICHHADESPALCLPSDFHGQADRLWRNQGDGSFHEATAELLGEVPFGMGLGVAAWDADGQGRLSLFVANDTTPCFFFRPELTDGKTYQLRERAIESGVAFNGAGKATGSMGVAVGDVDDNGRVDLLITNFYAEPNTLFINTAPGFFEDQTRRFGLEAPSINMLGFGTQFLDADLDGRLELFVSNGHVDDLSRFNRPYRMPPQLFGSDGRKQFVEMPKNRLGPYFEKNWLGRAVARIDWNRDGRDDLAVGHLHDPAAILSNTTAVVGCYLSLRLIGVQSNRDAIGTTVQAVIRSRSNVRQLTAGDGYQCSNERRLVFGTGSAGQIDELIVGWPSGLVQRLTDVSVPSEILLREGSEPIFLNIH